MLVARVVTVKPGDARTFVVVDAAMNDLLRPSLYGAWHDIRAVAPTAATMTATVVGPVCETGDTFAEGRDDRCRRRGRPDRLHDRRRVRRDDGLDL